MTIKVDRKTKAAIDMLAIEISTAENRSVTMTEAIWRAIEKHAPHIVERIEELVEETENGNDE